jgi:hypothetical protein
MHGVSLNVSPDMRPYSFIVPCGISTLGVTSINKVLGYQVEINKVRKEMRRQFTGIFEIELEDISLEEMTGYCRPPAGLDHLVSTRFPGSSPNEFAELSPAL